MLPNDSADIPAGATNTTTPMSDPTETARRVLSGHPSLPASEDLARALLETQAQMTEVMHEICRLQPNGSPPPGGLANHAAWCVQSAQAALAAANARAATAEVRADENRLFPCLDGPAIPWSVIAPHQAQARANHGQTLEALASRGGLGVVEMVAVLEDKRFPRPCPPAEVDRCLAVLTGINRERDALRTDLARVTAERDEAKAWQFTQNDQRFVAMWSRAEKAESDLATARESVRELVDRARDARRVFVILERCNAIPNGGEDHGNMLDIMDVRQKIDALLAKHGGDRG